MAHCVSESETDYAEQKQAAAKTQHRSEAEGEFCVAAVDRFQLFPAKVSNHATPSVSLVPCREFDAISIRPLQLVVLRVSIRH